MSVYHGRIGWLVMLSPFLAQPAAETKNTR